ncbi:uncharacterized protein FTJAE_5022 [Fusarium tjaetaba]|uniref:Chromo domain-containing protein n=1 Tax=Fusarium tjaetaba TaxID=1567544 RepID=A0A8H5RQ80_9HYPO|nr:uncharacterized protein FTJAE_5022 [Fusarium tjaetaba]KAF5638951.1 hypothetical protein FTJAE_5022 [Fusarium tjaetaba]
MSDLLKDPVFFSLTPDNYRRAAVMDPESPVSPLSVEAPPLSNFNTLDGQEPTATKTFSDLSPSFKKCILAYVRDSQSSLASESPSPPGYWPSHYALCDGKDSQDPSLIQEEDNFPPSPSSDRVFTNSVIRQVLGTRTIHQIGKCEYLVHWAGYPRGQLSWVSRDIIQPIAEHQIMFFEYERRLLCYKGSRGEIFTRKDAPQFEEADEEGCVGCARCGRGCN